MDFESYNNILMIGKDDMANNPLTGGEGSGRVDPSFVQTPVNELAKRFGIMTFESNDNGP